MTAAPDMRWREALQATAHPDLEQSLLGSLLIRPELLVEMPDLGADDCWDPRNRAVLAALHSLESAGVPIDVATVEAQLDKAGKLEAIGGVAYLGELALQPPQPRNAVTYARLIREHAVTRRVLEVCSEAPSFVLAAREHGEGLLDEILAALERIERPDLARETVTAADIVERQMAAIDRWFDDPASRVEPSLPWRVRTLDEATGGIPVGKLTTIGARTSVGKSTLLATFTMLRGADEPGVVFSNEDDDEDFATQMLAWEAKVDSRRIYGRNLCGVERDQLRHASARIRARLGHVRVITRASYTAAEIRRVVAVEKRRRHVRWFAVDYLQNMPRAVRSGDKLTEAVAADMQLFQRAALELGVAGILVSQLNRDSEKDTAGKKGGRPRMHNLSDSAAIERCSKLIVLLHRDDTRPENVLEAGIAKNKRGVSGPTCWHDLERRLEHAWIGDLPAEQKTIAPATDAPHWADRDRGGRDDEPKELFDAWREQS